MKHLLDKVGKDSLPKCTRCGLHLSQMDIATGHLDCPALERRDPALAQDPVNHPVHYTNHPSGIECIQIPRHMNFNLGNALKYIWRADLKGQAVEDLEKAAWYLRDEIARRRLQK